MAWRSLAGFQLVSMSTTLLAATRLMPIFPALVDTRNTPVLLFLGSLKAWIMACLRDNHGQNGALGVMAQTSIGYVHTKLTAR